MTKPIAQSDFAHAKPAPQPAGLTNTPAEHVFGLPPVLHGALFGGFLVYLAIMWAAFGEAQLAIPFVIFVVFIVASFVVPAMWTSVAPGAQPKQDWAWFREHGIVCATGHMGAGAAVVHVMLLPAMIILWGLSVAVITRMGA